MEKAVEPLEFLSPITDFMNREIETPWPGNLYFRHIDGIPSHCKPGYVRAQLLCYPECEERFEMAHLSARAGRNVLQVLTISCSNATTKISSS